MSAAYSLGISLVTDASATKASVSCKIETKTFLAHDGSFGGGATFDPIYEFSFEGTGSNPYSFSSPPSIASTSGTVLVESYSTVAKNDDFQTWKVTGKVYPGA